MKFLIFMSERFWRGPFSVIFFLLLHFWQRNGLLAASCLVVSLWLSSLDNLNQKTQKYKIFMSSIWILLNWNFSFNSISKSFSMDNIEAIPKFTGHRFVHFNKATSSKVAANFCEGCCNINFIDLPKFFCKFVSNFMFKVVYISFNKSVQKVIFKGIYAFIFEGISISFLKVSKMSSLKVSLFSSSL